MATSMGGTLLPIGIAARRAEISDEWLRVLCDRGEVEFLRDASGRRLIREAALEALIARRTAQRAAGCKG